MSIELTALRAMLDYDLYCKYGDVLMALDNLEPEYRKILEVIEKYYREYPDSKQINIDELTASFNYFYPTYENDEVYQIIWDKLKTIDINPKLTVAILNQVVERHVCSMIQNVGMEFIQGNKSEGIKDIEELVDEYHKLTGQLDDVESVLYKPDSLIDHFQSKEDMKGVSWNNDFLNYVFHKLPTKTLGHIFARPDGGKTSFALYLMCRFAYQLMEVDRPVLYLSNEEAIKRVYDRALVAAINKPIEWIESNVDEANRLWFERGGRLMNFIPKVEYISEVEKYIRAFHPQVVFIDQGPKINIPFGNKLDRTTMLQQLYNKYRTMADDYDTAIISLGQADNLSANKQYLSLNNLDSSKVGIPGELDWCLGMGYMEDNDTQRYLNVCKNKLTGLRGRYVLQFDIENCKFT